MLKYTSCARWHGTSNYVWVSGGGSSLTRGGNGVFSFYGGGNAWTSYKSCGRGVAVIGTGL